tara:strand:+ start:140 stop:784 length:645 start_codon:yes stop_codon:yes gene_type:complete
MINERKNFAQYSLVFMSLWVGGILISSCTQPPPPQNHFYRLGAPEPHIVHQNAPIEGKIMIKTMRADGLAGQRPIVYSEKTRPFEVRQYNYHYWFEAPPTMLQLQLIDHLRTARAAKIIKTSEVAGDGGCNVLGHVRRFERIIHDQKYSTVLVEIDLRLEGADHSVSLFTESYLSEAPLAGNQMDEMVRAFSNTVTAIFDQFLSDLIDSSVTCV